MNFLMVIMASGIARGRVRTTTTTKTTTKTTTESRKMAAILQVIAELRRPKGDTRSPIPIYGNKRKPMNWFSHVYHG